VDSIPDPKTGKILIDVKEDSVQVYDNGKGCLDHERFTAFRSPALEERQISFEGIGIKTMFQFFSSLDILSLDPQTGKLLRIDNFHVYEADGTFNPSYEYEVIEPDNLVYKEILSLLKGFNTMIRASKPCKDTRTQSLFNIRGNQKTAGHIMNIAEEPVRFLSQGGEIAVANFEGKKVLAACRKFCKVASKNRVEFSSAENVTIFGRMIEAIHAESPEKAVQIKIAISLESLAAEAFQDIYLEDSKLRCSVSEYVRLYLKDGIRKGSSARLQIRVNLSQYYKTSYRLNHNKHNLKDDPQLQKYLVSVLRACEKYARDITAPKKSKKQVKPVFSLVELAKVHTYAKNIASKFGKENEVVSDKCGMIIKCLNELSEEIQSKQAA